MPAAVQDLLVKAGRLLGSPAEARILLGHAAGTPVTRLFTLDSVPSAVAAVFDDLVGRRAAGVPVQHLTGVAHFRTVSLAVGPGVFIPRPETEVMTGWALATLEGTRGARVVDLCTGSGAIALALAVERPDLRVHAVEADADAFGYAERNLAGSGVDLRLGDMAGAFPELAATVDLVIANPPYVPLDSYSDLPAEVREHDPVRALFSGPDGLDATRAVAEAAARLLLPGGWVCSEHADVQGESAPEVFVRHGGFRRVQDHTDLAGRPRFVTAQRGAEMAGWSG